MIAQFTFDGEQLSRLFPYYILINKDFSIENYGKALTAILPPFPGKYFTDVFKIEHENDDTHPTNLNELGGFKMRISLVNLPGVLLEGNLEYLKSIGKYLFTGSAIVNVNSTNKVIQYPDVKQKHDEHFFERVLNEIPSDIVVFDTQHTYQFINPRAIKDNDLRIWMIGKTDEEYCQYRSRPMSLAIERRKKFNEVMLTKKQQMWEEQMADANGTMHYLLRNLYPVLDDKGAVDFLIGYGLDITDRKEIEEQLKLNEKRYRDLYNYCPALIYTHDLDGVMLSLNPAISGVLGFTADEIVGKNIKVLLPATDQNKIQEEYLDKVTSAGISKGIFRASHKNGTTKYLFYQNYRVEEQGQQAPYIIGFSQDITERITAEKELLIAKRNTENMSKVKDTFLANMSHELRTPMNGILGVTNLLAKTALNPQQTHYAHLISDSVTNLLTIINDILDMEKISSGSIAFEHHAFKVVDKVNSLVQSFQYKAGQKQIKLTLKNTLPGNLVVIGDQQRLAQIITNLLSNAVKFTNSGSINITLGLLHYTETDVIIEVTIKDTGVGISENRLSTIFDPFVKASSRFTSKFGGTGLGLSICKNLVEMQGGSIELHSEVDEGSTFTFSLPFKRGSIQAVAESKTAVLNLSKIDKRILVAEDIELNQFLVKTMLESWGGHVDIAVNGKEAIEMVIEKQYDLILMDIQMPEMDGITATKHIRELPHPEKANIPIIAFTANTLQGDSKLYRDAGMNDYITKPYTEEKLYEKITEALSIVASKASAPQTESLIIEQEITESEERLYNISMIEAIGKNNPAFIEKMIAMFVDFVEKDFDKLKEAANKDNWTEVGQIAHKLKSTFGNMGVDTLVKHVVDLEAKVGNPVAIINELDEGLKKVFEQMKADYPDLFTT